MGKGKKKRDYYMEKWLTHLNRKESNGIPKPGFQYKPKECGHTR
jgi:hypothetical protein